MKIDRLFVTKGDREKYYNPLKDEEYFKEHSDIFTLAALYGFINNARKKISKRDGLIRLHTFDQEIQIPLFKAIAVNAEGGDINILKDEGKVFLIVEEYANGGITLLYENVMGKWKEDYGKKLETLLRDKYKKLNIK